jgi:DsbC/DsbD-like thiol-disulfide interchange protein
MRSLILHVIISIFAGFIPLALATTVHQTPKKACTDYTVPLTVTSTNLVFGLPKFKDNYDATDFFVTLTQRTAADNFHPFKGIKNETATYKLSGTFCTPKNGGDRKATVLIATHGLNFGRGSVQAMASDKLLRR